MFRIPRNLWLLLIPAIALIITLAIVILENRGKPDSDQAKVLVIETQVTTTLPEETVVATEVAVEEPTPDPEATPVVNVQSDAVAQGGRIIIPAIGVDAPLTYKIVEDGGAMPEPNNEVDVAIYDFSRVSGAGGAPGAGGNTVLAGHVSYAAARQKVVFAEIGKLKNGDTVEIRYEGKTYRYSITNERFTVPGNNPSDSFAEAISITAEETLTLITCTGEFDSRTRTYSDRLILRAKRIS